jgi:hypothetical protein
MECWLLEDVVVRTSFWSAHSPSNRHDLTPAAASQLRERERERGNFSIIFNRVCVCVWDVQTAIYFDSGATTESEEKTRTQDNLYIHTHTSRHSVSSFAVRLFERMPFSFLIFFNLVILLLILLILSLFFSLGHHWLTDRHQTVKDKTRGGPWQFYIAAEFSGCNLVSPWNRKVKIIKKKATFNRKMCMSVRIVCPLFFIPFRFQSSLRAGRNRIDRQPQRTL